MKVLSIVEPLPFTVTTSAGPASSDAGSPAVNLATPDPREGFFQTGGGFVYIDLDLGAAVNVDTFFVGYVGNAANAFLDVYTGTVSPPATKVVNGASLAASAVSNPVYRHFLATLAAPVSARYVRLAINSNTVNTMSVGALATGLAFAPQYGQEYGAGRFVEDTGTVERLFGGGFGIDVGTRIGGYQWTFGDLQATEREKLYRLQRSLGATKSVLVVEDPDSTNTGLNEAIHWGLFKKLEPYERLDPLNTKWNLSIWDWL